MDNGIKGKFSVGLGLFDYINPILYGITVITILTHIHGVMPSGLFCHVLGVGTGMLLGILANLKDAKVHWVIEISNVICQLSVAMATILLFL